MATTGIENIVKKYLRSLQGQGINVSFGVVFGSQADRTATALSDIDLVIVSTAFNDGINCQTLDNLWRLAGRTDSRIEPIPCGRKQWEEGNYPPIIDIAKSKGRIVSIN